MFFLAIIASLGIMVCSCLSVYLWINIDEDILQQLISVDLIPNFLGFALSLMPLIACCILYHKYNKYRTAYHKMLTEKTTVPSLDDYEYYSA
jgi:hypothetical protein